MIHRKHVRTHFFIVQLHFELHNKCLNVSKIDLRTFELKSQKGGNMLSRIKQVDFHETNRVHTYKTLRDLETNKITGIKCVVRCPSMALYKINASNELVNKCVMN